MRTPDEKCLHFVLRHYQKNKLDTQKALIMTSNMLCKVQDL